MNKAQVTRWMIRTVIVAIVLLALATAMLVASGLHDELATADLGLVLGNKVESDGRPSARLRARLDRAAELYAGHYFPRLMVSGGVGKEGYDEGVVMREYLVAHGVPQDRVIVDSAGNTTFLTGKNAAALMRAEGLRSVLVISQYFHIPRCRLILQRLGISPVYAAHARFFEIRDAYSSVREVIGYAYYLIRPAK